MGRYRKIDLRTWSDPEFQRIWTERFEEPSRVPRSFGYRVDLRFRDGFSPRERRCRSLRLRFSSIRRKLRPLVVDRQGELCATCGATGGLVLDHVIPIRWGGTNDVVNLQLLCGSCNSAKGGDLPEPPGGLA
jgi:5-methylcytosine-specific restriction endonuclease McrA